MLSRVDDGPAIVACSTCRRPGGDDGTGVRDGARLIAALERVRASDRAYAGIAIQAMPCLFACGEACTIHLRAPDRIGYVLGRFEPDEASARAILDYALHYAASDDGRVPFALWPQGVKGHFIVRTPPPGFIAS
jgi:predicted metal-binding protein